MLRSLPARDEVRKQDPEERKRLNAEQARARYQPTEADRRLVRLVEDRFGLAQRARRKHEGKWVRCFAFYCGNQWNQWEPALQELVTEVLGEDYPDWRERVVDNQIPRMIVQWAAKQNKNRHITTALPNDPQDPEDVAAAGRSTKTLRHLDRTTERNRKRREAELQRAVFGTTFLHAFWDQDAKTTVAQQDPATGKVTGQEAFLGDADWEPLSVWEVYPQPVEWKQVRWCFKAKLRTLNWVRDTFPEKGLLVSDQKQDADGGTLISAALGANGPDAVGESEPSVRVLEYYEKPCRDYPKGRFAVVADGILLHSEDRLPHPKAEFPFIRVWGLPPILGTWGKSLVEDLLGQQEILNKVEGRILENFALTANPKPLIPREANIDEDAFDNQPGSGVEYDATGGGGAKPEWLQPPSLPAYAQELPVVITDRMGMIAGINEVTGQSNAPAGVKSGIAISILAEQDETRFAFSADEMADGLTALDRQLLGFVQALYTFPRQIRAIGPDPTGGEVLALMGTDLRGATEVGLDATPGINESLPVKRQRYLDYIESGLLQVAGDFETTAEVLRAMNENELSKIVAAQGQRLRVQQEAQRQHELTLAAQQNAGAEAAAVAEQDNAQAQAEQKQIAAQQQQEQAAAVHEQQLRQSDEKHQAGLAQMIQRMQLDAQRAQQRPPARAGK